MRNIWKLLAVLAVAGGLAACSKDKGPEGPTDFSGGCEAVDLGLSVKWAITSGASMTTALRLNSA